MARGQLKAKRKAKVTKPSAKAPRAKARPRPVPRTMVVRPEVEDVARAERRRGPRSIEGVLARLSAAQTLEAAYHAWDELRLERALAMERFTEDGRRLGEQAGFWVGAARAAGEAELRGGAEASGQSQVPVPASALQRAAAEAEAKLRAAAAAVEAQAKAADAGFEAAEQFVRGEIRARALRYAAARVPVAILKHPAGTARTILHLQRVGQDESVVLMLLLDGKLPTHYGFLFDDSTEDVTRPPPWLYPEEGVAQDQSRPGARELLARLLSFGEFAPVKGFLPLLIQDGRGGPPVLHRLLQRGAVMEVEIAEGDSFRNALTREEAERVAGAFLRLKLDGKIELDLGAG